MSGERGRPRVLAMARAIANFADRNMAGNNAVTKFRSSRNDGEQS